MNYIAMIQNRRSVRAFRGKEVSGATLAELRTHYERNCRRLIPEIATELVILDADAQSALEGAAGYQQFLIGAPHYLMLLSAPHIHAEENAGYMMEELVLKLTELDIDSCWLTFTDSARIKTALGLTTPAGGRRHRRLRLWGKDAEKTAAEYSEYVNGRCDRRAAVLCTEKGYQGTGQCRYLGQ